MNLESSEKNWLLLVPTESERRYLLNAFEFESDQKLELCGFGPVVPAAKTIQLIQKHSPDRVMLVGIAGALDPHLEIGNAYTFDRVACDGIGVGTASSFETAGEMGWPQWDDGDADGSIGDELPLACDTSLPSRKLLTVCSASKNSNDVESRKSRFPDAVAEDMEAFSVAVAGKFCQVPVHIVRGISNLAGDRDNQDWKIGSAMASAAKLALQIMDGVR